MFKYFDIHAHLNFPDFDEDRREIAATLEKEGIGAINVGTGLRTSRETVGLAEAYSGLWATVGVHPHDAALPFDEGELEALARHPKVVAIGECGLDYFRIDDSETKRKQKALFEKQIAIALKVGKPLMLHIRESYDDVLDMLAAHPEARAHAHFFAADWPTAKRFLDRGDTLSFTGVITFARDYDETVRNVPADRLMAETDCPYVAPAPYRGKRNQPAYVAETVKKMAEIRGTDPEELAPVLVGNALRTFGIRP